MFMSRLSKLAVVVFVLGAAFVWYEVLRPCCGARVSPSAVEAALARRFRSLSIPSTDRDRKNPFTSSPALLKEAAEHFADHCATCHGNDGSGYSEMGPHFYPPVPDMRLDATQRLTDGEVYSIIHNGVRWTGMPAWGDAAHDEDSWKLALFIHHLPQLSPGEIKDMQRLNPRSPAEIEEDKAEQEFLNGPSNQNAEPKHQH
jgi:mono/diheme cytochrome c family protein